jgi:hypothetical protein
MVFSFHRIVCCWSVLPSPLLSITHKYKLGKDFTTNGEMKKYFTRSREDTKRTSKCFAIFMSGDYAIHQKSRNGVS